MKKNKKLEKPSVDMLKAELDRINYRRKYARVIRSILYTLVTVSAIAVLVATLWMPVLQVHGSSMTPSLHDEEVVVAIKGSDFTTGDIIAFYYNNKILVKRVIALPGDWVDIDSQGNVYVNGSPIDEPYVSEKALGECNIELPYQVPAAKYFVLGDHRNVSTDSRNTVVGCVSEEQVVGKIVFRAWPLSAMGKID
jgi:signal peptidase I